MAANPVLAEARRGGHIENLHRGAFCVADPDGQVVASVGDIERLVFPRSAVKAIQALAMFRSGAVEKFGITDDMLAIACASHSGEPAHLEAVEKLLKAAGVTPDDLECGAHPPGDPDARRTLREAGRLAGPIHHNCSGKHAGMLATARALGVETKGYVRREHPVQQLVRAGLEAVTGGKVSNDHCGTDGCSVPTWALPLRDLATGFARLATGKRLSGEDGAAADRLVAAATGHPHLIAGTGRFDSDCMAAFGGRLMLKGGAEGVYCGGFADLGLGFALKVDDGSMPASIVIAAALVGAIGQPDARAKAYTKEKSKETLRTWRGTEVGELSALDAARPTL